MNILPGMGMEIDAISINKSVTMSETAPKHDIAPKKSENGYSEIVVNDKKMRVNQYFSA